MTTTPTPGADKATDERALFEAWLEQGHANGANESMWRAWQARAAISATPVPDQQSKPSEMSNNLRSLYEALGHPHNVFDRRWLLQAADEIDRLAAASAVPAPPAGQDWQPIETAPKDGRTLLLGRFNELGNWRTMRGQWFTQAAIDDEWEDPDGFEEGWYETAVEPDAPNCWPIAPTHFQLLPAAPATPP